jgi:hypothetical protein
MLTVPQPKDPTIEALAKVFRAGMDRNLVQIRRKREAAFTLRIDALQAKGKWKEAEKETSLLIEATVTSIKCGSRDEMKAFGLFVGQISGLMGTDHRKRQVQDMIEYFKIH